MTDWYKRQDVMCLVGQPKSSGHGKGNLQTWSNNLLSSDIPLAIAIDIKRNDG